MGVALAGGVGVGVAVSTAVGDVASTAGVARGVGVGVVVLIATAVVLLARVGLPAAAVVIGVTKGVGVVSVGDKLDHTGVVIVSARSTVGVGVAAAMRGANVG